jgi:hypothetical protein
MVNTRRSINTQEENNNNQNPPPPPPSTLEQQMAMQTQILQALAQTMVHMQQQQPNHVPQPHQPSRLGEFKRTQPPVFSYAVEPIDADDWLKDIDRKLHVAQCNDREMVLYASHQLTGQALDWWEAYCAAHENPAAITWMEFKASFRTHHLSSGDVRLKKKEFMSLKQGPMTVREYLTKFTQLSRYAPNEVDTEEKKQERFLEGLNDAIEYALLPQEFPNFQALVNKALMVEHKRRQLEEKKRKMSFQGQGSNTRSRGATQMSPQGPMFRSNVQYRTQSQNPVQRSNYQMP